jgi:hypothetical protein
MSVDRVNYRCKASLLRQGEDDVQDVRESQDVLAADMIMAEKEREGFMKYIYKSMNGSIYNGYLWGKCTMQMRTV